jgi:pyruvate ferredoxin oxidoreductase alpha subunit
MLLKNNVIISILKMVKKEEKKEVFALTGAQASAYAMKQINPDVVPAYPITPQTPIMEAFSVYVSNGEVDTELIRVESEHSAMSAAVGASAAGGRVMTATASNGLALMFEIVYIAASTRLPMVMNVVNRALSGPINIHCDHSDSMACRDSGWIQLYSENAQEAYDNTIFAMKLAESVKLPVMVMQDGFITSHSVQEVSLVDDKIVKKYVSEYKPENYLLNLEKPITVGPLDLFDYYFEHKAQQIDAMQDALKTFYKQKKDFEKITKRKFDAVDTYKLEDADMAIFVMNSSFGTTKYVIDELRKKNLKVGAVRLKLFRPFPRDEFVEKTKHLKAMAILDRSASFGAYKQGPLFTEISAIYNELDKKPKLCNYIYGLGGRDFEPKFVRDVFDDLNQLLDLGTSQDTKYLGLRK